MDSDSDSSVDDSYTTTSVLLGYASKEATDDPANQLGGQSSFLDPAQPPSASLARCKSCKNLMPQLLQLRADLPERFPGHERRLHVWACRRKPCKRKPGSVRAVRSSRADSAAQPALAPAPTPKPAPKDLGTSIFGGKALFGAPPKPDPAEDLPATFAAKARLAADAPGPAAPAPAAEAWPADLPAPYPSYYLDAGYEELEPEAGPAGVPVVEEAGGAGSSKDEFESASDKTFLRFADRLAQNPEQVLRYEFGGVPLLYSRDDAVGKALAGKDGVKMPRCERCGAARLFEVQLVPHAILELEAADDVLDGMEWGTIIVGVCANDCTGEPQELVNVEEWVGVQWEEQGK